MSVENKSIFRVEVLSGNNSGEFGEIRILHSMSGWVITLSCLGVALALFLLFIYGTIAKNVAAAGVTETLATDPASTEVVATIFVPVVNASALGPGQRVTLHYDAYPYQKYGLQTGIVRTVDSGFVYGNSLPEGVRAKLRGAAGSGDPDTTTYRRITLTLVTHQIQENGRTQKVPEGLLLEANLPQAATPLSRWLPGN